MKFINFRTGQEIYSTNIYEDDTIEVVWYKLSKILSIDINNIYLFTSKQSSYTPEQVIHHFEKKDIPWYDLNNYVNNFQPTKLDERQYTHEDILEYNFINVIEQISLGKKFKFSVRPDHVIRPDLYNEEDIIHEPKKLLLDYMPFFDIQVYIKQRSDLDLYFNKSIDTSMIERRIMNLNEMYQLSHEIPLHKGIQHIICSVHPSNKINIPLNTLFNLLHTSESLSMIQYNSGKEDIVYKLYCEKEDIKGNPIPNLSEYEIVKKDQSYKKSITAIFSNRVKYAFKEDGSILFEATCKNYDIDEINALLKSHEDVLKQVHTFMIQSGFLDYPIFTSVENSTIHNITYSITFNTENYKENVCGNRFFVSLKDSEKRYTRVSNYNENKLIHELCVNEYLKDKKDNLEGLKTTLKRAFNLSDADAFSYLKSFNESANLVKEDQGAFKIKEIVGFPTRLEKADTELTFILSNIKSIYYLPCIEKNIATYIAVCTQKHSIVCERDVPVVQVTKLNFTSELNFESDDEDDIVVVDDTSEQDDEIVVVDDDMEDMEGGAVSTDKDMKLNNVNFIIYRIKQKFGPTLDKEYTKKCQLHRCPIALKDKEAADPSVEKYSKLNHNGSTYICPKYWDMVNKIPLTDKDIEDKKLKIINIKKGIPLDVEQHGSVYKLNDGEYPFPGLLEDEIGPCCFKKDKDRDSKKPRNVTLTQRITTGRTNPLTEEGAIANIPQSIQYFFELNEKCMIEPGRHLLRYGIKSPRSFIECIAACLRMSDSTYDLKKTCSFLLNAAKPIFKQLNNARLCKQFTWPEFKHEIQYLDYTYLWEIINIVFKTNLIILRVPTLKELEIICPSNRYMNVTFDRSRTLFMILEHDDNGRILFEPIIDHNISNNSHTYLHNFYDKLNTTFLKIEKYFLDCHAESGFYRTNVISTKLQSLLQDETIQGQVVHNEMCIGLSVNGIFVPCYPSTLVSLKQVDMPIKDYKTTIDTLTLLSRKCHCLPVYKVVEYDKIIGIITETNSFVPCIKTSNMVTIIPVYPSSVKHEYITLSTEAEQKRVDYIKYTTFEKNIHSSLRLMLKMLVANDYRLRKEVNLRIQSKTISESYLKKILDEKYEMVDTSDEYVDQINTCKGACLTPIIKLPRSIHGKPTNYFFKLSQELNKNTRISAFIIKPQLLIPNVPYSLHDHEIVLLSEMIHSYFQYLKEPKRLSQYTTYDNIGTQKMFTKIHYIKI